MQTSKTVLSVIGLDPVKISAAEIWFRELSEQLGCRGFTSVLCYLTEPREPIREFLQLSNVRLELLRNSCQLQWQPIRAFLELLRRHRPRIVHCHYTGFVSPYAWLSKLYSTEKVFFTDHTSRPEGYVARPAPLWKRALIPIINHPLTYIQCVSNYGYKCNVTARVLPRARYRVIHNGVDTCRAMAGLQAAEAFRTKHSIPSQRAIVVQVSWIIKEKGVHDLLRAAQLVLSRMQDVQFVVVGEGPYRTECQRFATELGISDHVTWTGVVHDPLLEGVYAAADVVCQMSRWEEVFGQVIAEAMASRKPVVATRVGGIPELVTDNVTGFLVERGDAVAMAGRILHLLSNATGRVEMGNKAWASAVAKFDHRKNVSQLIELYGLTEPKVTLSNAAHSGQEPISVSMY